MPHQSSRGNEREEAAKIGFNLWRVQQQGHYAESPMFQASEVKKETIQILVLLLQDAPGRVSSTGSLHPDAQIIEWKEMTWACFLFKAWVIWLCTLRLIKHVNHHRFCWIIYIVMLNRWSIKYLYFYHYIHHSLSICQFISAKNWWIL